MSWTRGLRPARRVPVAAIRRISPKPIRYVIDTGPTPIMSAATKRWPTPEKTSARGRRRTPPRSESRQSFGGGVLRHMATSPGRRVADRVFHYFAQSDLPERRGDRSAASARGAHRQRRLCVLPPIRRRLAGDVLDTRQFPVIDVERGGSIQGEIAALNRLVKMAVRSAPVVTREAGTIVVPGHGRLCDQYRRRRLSRHGDDRFGSGERSDQGGTIARRRQGRPAGEGLRGTLRQPGRDPDRFIEAVYTTLSRAGLSGPRRRAR